MSYKTALDKAWKQSEEIGKERKFEVKFLNDIYEIEINSRKVFSSSCNVPPPEYIAILILHYLIQKIRGLPQVAGDWVSFKELPGGQGYYDAFKKRALDPIVRKYGDNPQTLTQCLEKLPGKKIQYGDCGIVLEVFENIPVLVTVWGKDEEFSAEANILFDRSISGVFCTEDIAVLADIISRLI